MLNTIEIINQLKQLANEQTKAGKQKYGINTDDAFGISIKEIRELAKSYGKNHEVALELWDTGFHEARILASMMANADILSPEVMDLWMKCFNSWDLCDQVCGNLFEDSPYAYQKAAEWADLDNEYEKRAGFVMIARLAISDKKKEDKYFLPFLEIIKRESVDDRNFVKKAVNWALRQIGKRSFYLREQALNSINELIDSKNKTAIWIAKDACKELTNEKIIKRIKQ